MDINSGEKWNYYTKAKFDSDIEEELMKLEYGLLELGKKYLK